MWRMRLEAVFTPKSGLPFNVREGLVRQAGVKESRSAEEADAREVVEVSVDFRVYSSMLRMKHSFGDVLRG